MTYTPRDTLDFFIKELEGDLESLSLEIREETNFDDEVHKQMMDHLSEEWDEKNEHLQNLKQIKELLNDI
jgi:predicted RND superfamily exporter protein